MNAPQHLHRSSAMGSTVGHIPANSWASCLKCTEMRIYSEAEYSPRSVVSGDIILTLIFVGVRSCLLRWCQTRVWSSKVRLFFVDRFIFRVEFPHWHYISNFTRLRAVSRRQHGSCKFIVSNESLQQKRIKQQQAWQLDRYLVPFIVFVFLCVVYFYQRPGSAVA